MSLVFFFGFCNSAIDPADRSRSNLVAEAIEAYIEDQAWWIEAVEEGIKEADKGKFASDKEIRKTFKKWGVNED